MALINSFNLFWIACGLEMLWPSTWTAAFTAVVEISLVGHSPRYQFIAWPFFKPQRGCLFIASNAHPTFPLLFFSGARFRDAQLSSQRHRAPLKNKR